jgi:hypothetical protein
MKKISINLEEIVKYFDNHDNRTRIKKLIIGSCKNCWETNSKTIEQLDWFKLIQELHETAPTSSDLQLVLIQTVNKINKKSIYFLLANTIFCTLQPLYLENSSELNAIQHRIKMSKYGVDFIRILFDWIFLVDLKFKLSTSKQILRAKFLVFSALNYKFKYLNQDLVTVKEQDFDNLVRHFFYTCDTTEEIEFRLYGSATYISSSPINIEVAHQITDSMKWFYGYLNNHLREKNQRLGIEELEKMSQEKVNIVVNTIEKQLRELSSSADRSLKVKNSEEFLNVKYQMLYKFIQNIQVTSSIYLDILKELEQQERQKLHSDSF